MARKLNQLRNLGIIAHIDAGKTTVTERMLFYAHFSHRVGQVDSGTTITDFDPEERERGITIQSACVTFEWKDVTINLIDTPGHVDFTAEVERSLRVLDGGVVVFSAREGVEAQSETVWHQADKYHVPRIAFINKMDREGADFYVTLEEIEKRLECTPLPITLPVGAGPLHLEDGFRAIVDLIGMKMLTFSSENKGAEVLECELPDALADEAELWRGQLLDRLSLYSDELTEKLLSEEPVTESLIRRVLREATLVNLAVPVLCGSALAGIGVQPLLDAVAHYLPSPVEMPPVEGIRPGKGTASGTHPGKSNASAKDDAVISRKPDPSEPFCGLLFKIQADRHGDLDYVRVYSGRLKANSRVFNPGKNEKENVPQLWRIQADRRKQVDSVTAGDIIGIVGLRHSVTGDTLCDARHPILLESITFPETVVSMAIEPESSTDRKKLAEVLEMLKRQDPTFRARENEETGQTLISGMGELHLEVIKHKLLRDFKLNVHVHQPRVSYRETVEKSVEVTGQCHRTMAGQQLFAELTIRLEPFADAAVPVTVTADCGDALPGDASLPDALLAAALDGLEQEAEGGGSLGFPLMQVRLTLLDGKCQENDSSEIAMRMAAGDAFSKALRAAGIVLLEPVMRVEVTAPEGTMGDIVGDLQQRRAVITRTHNRGKLTVIDAEAPLANLFGYSNAMRGLSQGRAQCTMEPHAYGPAPPEVLESFM